MTTEDNLYIGTNRAMHIVSEEDMYIHTFMNQHTTVVMNHYLLATETVNIQSGTDMKLTTATNFNVVAAQNTFVTSGAGVDVKAGADMKLSSSAKIHAVASGDAHFSAGGVAHIKAGGNVAIDGAKTVTQTGAAAQGTAAADGTGADNPTPALKSLVHGMVPPPLGKPIYPVVEPMVGPAPHGEESFMYETPSETNTQGNKAYAREQQSHTGVTNTVESETAPSSGGGGTILASAKQKEILAMSTFTADFRLSKHFTLGMMFDGGFNNKHRLVDQNGLTRQQIVANLSALCENILERYLEELPDGIQGYRKKWLITSGYRMGASKSDHAKGRACDLQLVGRDKKLHYNLIQKLEKLVPYDQMLLEYQGANSVWIHTGFRGDSNTTFGGGKNRTQASTVIVDTNTFIPGFSLRA